MTVEDNEYMLSHVLGVSEDRDVVYVWSPQAIPEVSNVHLREGQYAINFFSGRAPFAKTVLEIQGIKVTDKKS